MCHWISFKFTLICSLMKIQIDTNTFRLLLIRINRWYFELSPNKVSICFIFLSNPPPSASHYRFHQSGIVAFTNIYPWLLNGHPQLHLIRKSNFPNKVSVVHHHYLNVIFRLLISIKLFIRFSFDCPKPGMRRYHFLSWRKFRFRSI